MTCVSMGNCHLLSELFSLHLTIIHQEIQFVLQKPAGSGEVPAVPGPQQQKRTAAKETLKESASFAAAPASRLIPGLWRTFGDSS